MMDFLSEALLIFEGYLLLGGKVGYLKCISFLQMAAVSIIPIILDYFEDDVVRSEILPKTRTVYEQNGGDVKIVLAVLACVSKILDKLDRSAIIDEVLPLLLEVKLQDVNVLVRVLGKSYYCLPSFYILHCVSKKKEYFLFIRCWTLNSAHYYVVVV